MGQNASKVIRQVKDVSTKLSSFKQPTVTSITGTKLNVQQQQQQQPSTSNKSARDIAFGAATTEITTTTTTTTTTTKQSNTNNNNEQPIIDPFSGFQRGTGIMSNADLQQEQFLAKNQQNQKDSTSTEPTTSATTASSSSTTVKERVMPIDLLKFINDAGPMRMIEETQNSGSSIGTTGSTAAHNDDANTVTTIQLRQKRLPKHLQKQLEYEQLQEQQVSSIGKDTSTDTDIDTTMTSDKTQSIFYDKTRVISSMRLAKNVEGFETKRTTSFSNRNIDNDNNELYEEYDGYEIIQSTTTTEYDTTTALTTQESLSSAAAVSLSSSPRKRRPQQNDNGLTIIELYKLLSANNSSDVNTARNNNYVSLNTGLSTAQMNLLSLSASTTSTNTSTSTSTSSIGGQNKNDEENSTISTTTATDTSVVTTTDSNTSAATTNTNTNKNTNFTTNESTKIIDPSIHVYTTALKYTHVPVLMKDTDGSYIGSFVHNVSLLQDMKLKLLDTTKSNNISNNNNNNTSTSTIPAEVKLVLQDIHEMTLKKPYRDETVRKQRRENQ